MPNADDKIRLWKVLAIGGQCQNLAFQIRRALDAPDIVARWKVVVERFDESGLLIAAKVTSFVRKNLNFGVLVEIVHHGAGSTFRKAHNGKVQQPLRIARNVPIHDNLFQRRSGCGFIGPDGMNERQI